MSVDEVVAASAVERRAVADLLDGLDEQQLATPSLCVGWDVRTVAAHLVSAVALTGKDFVGAMIRARGNPHRANDLLARDVARRPVAELADLLRRHAESRFAPPVTGPRAPLTDALVHAGDMRVPLGLPHDPAPAHVRTALDFVTGSRPFGFVPRGRLKGILLVAEDLGRTWGEGEPVEGRGIDLLMAACGRAAMVEKLRGVGAVTLAARVRSR
jgi:uncharacterized protein (TIGR03083 family)